MSVWEPVKEEGELPTRGLAWTEKRWGGAGGRQDDGERCGGGGGCGSRGGGVTLIH